MHACKRYEHKFLNLRSFLAHLLTSHYDKIKLWVDIVVLAVIFALLKLIKQISNEITLKLLHWFKTFNQLIKKIEWLLDYLKKD